MVIREIMPEFIPGAKIKVLGIGGCGCKAINRMVSEGLEGVGFVGINTDAQDLATCLATEKVNVGLNLTKGLGAGANPEIGRKAAEESEAEIKAILQDTDMVFITLGLGGGTGTGAGPVVASIAKSMGILTVAIITRPFSFEGKKRELNSEEGLKKLRENVDTLIVIPNDKIFTVIDKKTSFKQAFIMIDKILFLGVQGISDLIVKPGDINIDFADIKVVMQNSGNALLGIGYGAGEKRATEAARKAIENPLLETNLDKAKNIIFAVTGGHDLTPVEVKEAASVVEEIIAADANLIWGMTFDESYEDEVKVIIIATGFQEQSKDDILKTPQRDILGRPTRSAEDFITRGLKREINNNNNNEDDEEKKEVKNSGEDYETPPFMTKKLKAN